MQCDRSVPMKLLRGTLTVLSLSGEDYLRGRTDPLQRSDLIVQ